MNQSLSITANAISAIAYRDLLKFVRDRARIIGTLVFPLIFIGILGTSFQAGFGEDIGYNYLVFTFTGVLAQTLFQTTAQGIISLIEDRENDFSQEMFVSPISRYTIIIGKIVGETLVAFLQAIAVILFGFVLGIPLGFGQVMALLPVAIIISLFGGAFGLLVMSNLPNQRAAQQIFPFIIFPQFFLAGVFTPIQELPWYLFIASRISPMTYAVDFTRNAYYAGTSEYSAVVLHTPWLNFGIIVAMFVVFSLIGTWIFVRSEQNK